MSDRWDQIDGFPSTPPRPGTIAFERWHENLRQYYAGLIDGIVPTSTYYFSATGSDAASGLTINAPKKSPTEMQEIIDAYDCTDDGLDIVLLPGIWEDSADRTTVTLNKPRIRVRAYPGSGKQLPIFNRFDMKYESTGWSADTGTTYVRAEATSIEWLALKYDWFNPLTQATSLSEVRATLLPWEKGRWYQTGGNLYVNLGGPDPNTRFLEAAPTSQTQMFRVTADLCLVQDIITLGFFGVQSEGVQAGVTGNNMCMFRNVTCFGGNTHSGPTHLASTSGDTGGIVLMLGCKTGGMRYIDGITIPTGINLFTNAGGATYLIDRCEAIGGALPLTTWTVPTTSTMCRSHGQAVLSHTASSTHSLAVVSNFRIRRNGLTWCNLGISLGNMPSAAGVVSAMRAFAVGQRIDPRPQSSQHPMIWPRVAGDNNDVSESFYIGGGDDVLFFRSQLEDCRAGTLANPFFYTVGLTGRHLLCSHDIIVRDPELTTHYSGTQNSSCKWWGCLITILQDKGYDDGGGGFDPRFVDCGIELFDTTTIGGSVEISDSILVNHIETLTLNVGTLDSNLYVGVDSAQYADDDNATAVTFSDLPPAAARLMYPDVLGEGTLQVNGLNIEVDFDGNPRSAISGYDFGPWQSERWPQEEGMTVGEAVTILSNTVRNAGGEDPYTLTAKHMALRFIGNDILMRTQHSKTMASVALSEDDRDVSFDDVDEFTKDRIVEAWVEQEDEDGDSINQDVAIVDFHRLREERDGSSSEGTPEFMAFTDPINAQVYPVPDEDLTLNFFWIKPLVNWEMGDTTTATEEIVLNAPVDYLEGAIRFLGPVALQFTDPQQVKTTESYRAYIEWASRLGRPVMGVRSIKRKSLQDIRGY